ncbi:MAG: hypothetical protein QF689_12115, partial [Candidatus Latescibacteria bacterium]|nr:hypothetical protein [Candidatus Latescibacterota bacterium]
QAGHKYTKPNPSTAISPPELLINLGESAVIADDDAVGSPRDFLLTEQFTNSSGEFLKAVGKSEHPGGKQR